MARGRIGILTIHHVPNYGAVWQCYALSRAIARLGHEVEVIDYRPDVAVRHYRERHRQLPRRLGRSVRRLRFAHFVRFRLPLGPVRCADARGLEQAVQRYAAVVAGSDQIWCTGEGSYRGFDPNFFLELANAPAQRRISYAASAGNTASFAPHAERIGTALAGFSAISVRDGPTAERVREATGSTPEVVLDPVFLHDFAEVTRKVPCRDEVVVFAQQPRVVREPAVRLAGRLGMPLVALGGPCGAATVQRRFASPVAWLRGLRAARAVVTDSYHGAATALQFGVPVLVVVPPSKSVKLTDLLQRLELPQLLLDATGASIDAVHGFAREPAAFAERLESVLGRHRAHSLAFLEKALTG